MHWYDWLLIAVLLIFVYKRAEGYFPAGGNFAYDGSLDSRNIPGGRPAEIFTYAHTSNKVTCNTK